MKLEVGMYVRTKDGKIAKFIKYDEKDKNELVTTYYEYSTIWIKDVVKASYVLGELLEVGDFIDIHYIYEIKGTTICTYSGWFIDFDDIEDLVEKIVTKEQFESIKYSLEE